LFVFAKIPYYSGRTEVRGFKPDYETNKKLPKFEFPISILVGAGPKIRNIFSSTTVGIDLGAHYFISNKVSSFFEVSHLADWFTKPKELSIKNLFILSLGIKYNLADL
jgi:hypothetical protein